MSKYKPAEQIDTPADQLNRALKRADDEARRQLSEWMKMIDVFWCASVTHGENAQTKEQVQAKIVYFYLHAKIVFTLSNVFNVRLSLPLVFFRRSHNLCKITIS